MSITVVLGLVVRTPSLFPVVIVGTLNIGVVTSSMFVLLRVLRNRVTNVGDSADTMTRT